MRHHSCDLCGVELGDDHFIVSVESHRADQEHLEEHGMLDRDPLADIERLLEDQVHGDDDVPARAGIVRFDLCSRCQQRYLRDPLARHGRRVRFSEN